LARLCVSYYTWGGQICQRFIWVQVCYIFSKTLINCQSI